METDENGYYIKVTRARALVEPSKYMLYKGFNTAATEFVAFVHTIFSEETSESLAFIGALLAPDSEWRKDTQKMIGRDRPFWVVFHKKPKEDQLGTKVPKFPNCVLFVFTDESIQRNIIPWKFSMEDIQVWKSNGDSYTPIVSVPLKDLYRKCVLLPKFMDECAFCGAATNMSCVRTLMAQNAAYTENAPVTTEKEDGISSWSPEEMGGYFTKIPQSCAFTRFMNRAVIGNHIPNCTICTLVYDINVLEDVASHLRAIHDRAAATNRFRRQHCDSCLLAENNFCYRRTNSHRAYDLRHQCGGAIKSGKEVMKKFYDAVERLKKDNPEVWRPYSWWVWVAAQHNSPIVITGKFDNNTRTSQRRVVMSPFVYRGVLRLKFTFLGVRYSYLNNFGSSTIECDDWEHFKEECVARGWTIKKSTIVTPKMANGETMRVSHSTKKLLTYLHNFFNVYTIGRLLHIRQSGGSSIYSAVSCDIQRRATSNMVQFFPINYSIGKKQLTEFANIKYNILGCNSDVIPRKVYIQTRGLAQNLVLWNWRFML